MVRTLWNDEAGFIISAELVLVATIVVIGLICGLCCLRMQVVEELCDVGHAIGALNQSFAISGCKIAHGCDIACWTGGSFFIDVIDFCQQGHQSPGDLPSGLHCVQCPMANFPTCGELGSQSSGW